MRYVFGPVPSRRLGQSLGIDTIPLKTCNWNCVYCQLGRTVPLTNARRAYFPREAILAEVAAALATHATGAIDWVTFVGSGEPTLHSDLGWLIRRVRALTELPVAVITNGALLYRPEVRRELAAADAVLPSLDAGSPALYRRLNRPHPDCTFARLLDGLIAFRREYQGRLWLEVMLVRGLNDTPGALADLAAAVRCVAPDAVHLNLPTRPPAETWVEPPDDGGLRRARMVLGDIARVIGPAAGTIDASGAATPAEAILSIITRHPLSHDDLIRALAGWSATQVEEALALLSAGGEARIVERYGTRFWVAAATRFPEDRASRTVDPRVSRG